MSVGCNKNASAAFAHGTWFCHVEAAGLSRQHVEALPGSNTRGRVPSRTHILVYVRTYASKVTLTLKGIEEVAKDD